MYTGRWWWTTGMTSGGVLGDLEDVIYGYSGTSGERLVKKRNKLPDRSLPPDDRWRNSSHTLMAMLKRITRVALFDAEPHRYMVPVTLMVLSRTVNLATVRVAESHSHTFRHPSEEDHGVIERATYALSEIARLSNGARDIVDTKITDHILGLLESPSPNIRKWTCRLVGRLASHKFSSTAVLELNPFMQLANLSCEEDLEVLEQTVYALSQLAGWLDEMDVLIIGKPGVAQVHCAGHFRVQTFDEDPGVIGQATYALAEILRWLDGAQAIAEEKTLDHVLELLSSQSSKTRKRTCKLVGRLASHESTASTVLELNPSEQLVFLLRRKVSRPLRMQTSIYFEELQELSPSTDAETQVRIHKILDNLDKGTGIAL
ncbi:armadillo-type protein [Mycena capillaripes]|nr:armadillo-type protein [Mycena capillaripes]